MTVTTLPTVELGSTGMRITRVGFGAWALGGPDWAFGWGEQDDAESIATIRHAIEHGVNWIDTAAVYGLGHSEEIVAEALADLPSDERPYVFTKGGLIWDTSEPRQPPRRVAAPDSLRREVDDSLQRLRMERIDLYQVHWPPEDGTPVDAYWQTLVDLRREGKVRAIGLCNHSPAQLERAEAVGHVDALQPPLSAIRRAAAEAEIPWCRDHGTGVIVYSPMQSGLLTGTFSLGRTRCLPADDWRAHDSEFLGSRLGRNLILADALRPIAARRRVSVAAVAVAWALAWPGVTGAIVGARHPSQVDGWLPAATLSLSKADLDEIAAAIARSGAGQGPAHPLGER